MFNGILSTFGRIQPYLADFGITRVGNVTGLDRVGIPCHVAHKPMGTSLSNGSGKGLTPAASRISAVMEAIEQSYWEAAPAVAVTSTARRLASDGLKVVDCDAIPRMRHGLWNVDLELDWSPMFDLVTGEEVWVPTEVVHVLLPSRRGAPTFIMGSNGLASGNTLEEAILSALNELIERDANALHTLRGPDTPADTLDVAHLCAVVGDPMASLVETIERADLQLDLVDHTSDLGVPTYNAFVHDLALTRSGAFGGLGTNLDPVVALCRAITEAVQSRTLIIAACMALQALGAAVLLAGTVGDSVSRGLLFGMSVALGAARAFQHPAQGSLVGALLLASVTWGAALSRSPRPTACARARAGAGASTATSRPPNCSCTRKSPDAGVFKIAWLNWPPK